MTVRGRLCALAVVPAAVLGQAVPAAAERALDKSVWVSAEPARVWAAWTTADGVRTWLAPEAVVDARVDGPFRIFFDPLAVAGRKGADDRRFLALQPPRMLSFDWNAATRWPMVRAQRTVVVVRLDAVDGGTRVRLHPVGWGELLARPQRRLAEASVRWDTRWVARPGHPRDADRPRPLTRPAAVAALGSTPWRTAWPSRIIGAPGHAADTGLAPCRR